MSKQKLEPGSTWPQRVVLTTRRFGPKIYIITLESIYFYSTFP